VLVPLSDSVLMVDLFARWNLPAILVARTTLGTINHSLLSLEALRMRGIEVRGVIFCGEQNAASELAIVRLGEVAHLGRLPRLDPLDASSLHAAFLAAIRTDLLS
jgi:dethiobiotin synthetase